MLNPKHILITGASSGIGAALAAIYAAPGIRLSLHGRNQDRLAHVAESAREHGAAVTVQAGTVTDSETMGAWIAACDGIQPLDLVIANAGISGGTGRRGAPHEDELDGLARSIFAINVDGLFNTLHPVIPLMTQRKQGQIAIMASLASFRGFAGSAAYCASKAMVRVYGEALRDELKVDGIAVNVVCPGFIKTPMTDANPFPMPFMMSAERAAHIIKSGLAHNRARIAFPWRLYAMIRLLNLLPQDWMARWTSRLPRKS